MSWLELIDCIQDIISIPFAIFICVMLWKIRKTQKTSNKSEVKNG
jgi:hypothetical protein